MVCTGATGDVFNRLVHFGKHLTIASTFLLE